MSNSHPDPSAAATPRSGPAPRQFGGHALKLLVLGFGWLLLSVLLGLIGDLVADRERYRQEAESRVAAGWGGRQVLGAPLLRLTRPALPDHKGRPQAQPDLWISASQARLQARLESERRRLGLFDIPLYQADVGLTARFEAERLAPLAEEAFVAAELLLPLHDPRGLRSTVSLQVAGTTLRLVPQPGQFAGQRLLGAQLPLSLLSGAALEVSGEFVMAGVQSLHALPGASDFSLQASGDWPDPGFASGLLPRLREVAASGFEAQWQVYDFNSGLPPRFSSHQLHDFDLYGSRIGVELQQPGEVYQRNERAWKYGTLFVALTLASWFLIELLLRRQLWALDYALIGVSQVCFYLLLLALSEHLGFALAYAIAALVFVGMVGSFAVGLLGSRRRGGIAALLLAAAYAALYLLIGSESHALLLGALLITALIGAAMAAAHRLRTVAATSAPAAA